MEQHELFKSIYNSNLKSRAVNVMACLITYMNNKDNSCFPAIKTIAKCCSMGVSTVKRALADLVEAGFVEKEARFIEAKNMAQTSNLYRLSAVFTEPEPSKAKEPVAPVVIDEIVAEAQTEDIAVFSFNVAASSVSCEDVSLEQATLAEQVCNVDTPAISPPKPKEQAQSQTKIAPLIANNYFLKTKWTPLQPILVPP